MEMIKILWIDDKIDKGFIELAYFSGLDIEYFNNWKDGYE